MAKYEKNKVSFLKVLAVLMLLLQVGFLALMVLGIGETYGSHNSLISMINYLINIFYIKSTTVLKSISQFLLGLGFIFFFIYQIKQLFSNIGLIGKFKVDDLSDFDACSLFCDQFGKALASLVFYLFYIQAMDSFSPDLWVYIALILGLALLILFRSVKDLEDKNWVLQLISSIVKYALFSTLMFLAAPFVFQPIVPLFVNGFRALIIGIDSLPLYTLYTYFIYNILLAICFCLFIRLSFAVAAGDEYDLCAKSKALMIFALIILFATCILKDLGGGQEQFTFNFDKLKDWFEYAKPAMIPFALYSISLFALSFFNPQEES